MNRTQICTKLGELVERKHILEASLERVDQEIARIVHILSALPPEESKNGVLQELIKVQE